MIESSKPLIRKKIKKKSVVFTPEDDHSPKDIYAVLAEVKKLDAEHLYFGN